MWLLCVAGSRKQLSIFSVPTEVHNSIVTKSLAPAILQLHDMFVLLAGLMDVVCFREVWRVVAIAATRYSRELHTAE